MLLVPVILEPDLGSKSMIAALKGTIESAIITLPNIRFSSNIFYPLLDLTLKLPVPPAVGELRTLNK